MTTNIRLAPKGNRHLMTPIIRNGSFIKSECDFIINNLKSVKKDTISLPNVRTNIASIILERGNEWLFTKISTIVQEINQEFYKFDLVDLREINYLEFNSNNFISWHRENEPTPEDFLAKKLLALLFLSEQSSYKGGRFRVLPESPDLIPDTIEAGTMVVIPTYMLYCFEPLISGTNSLLITDIYGQLFR